MSMDDKKSLSDEYLCKKAQDGDRAAFDSLVARYVLSVNKRTNAYTESGLEQQDLSQEGMIGLMAAIRKYDPALGASFKTFAWLLIDRSIISAVKSAFRKKQIPRALTVYIDDESDLVSGEFSDPEFLLIAKEDLQNFNNRISECLTEFEKSVLKLYLSHNSYNNIAKTLNIPIKSVDNAMSRIRRKLK